MKRLLETDYVHAICARASLSFLDHRFFRRNVGAIKVDDRYFRASIPGQCDLYVIGRGGWHGEVEVKRFGKLSEAQIRWRDWCASWSVPWIVLEAARTEMAPATLDRWMLELGTWIGLGK